MKRLLNFKSFIISFVSLIFFFAFLLIINSKSISIKSEGNYFNFDQSNPSLKMGQNVTLNSFDLVEKPKSGTDCNTFGDFKLYGGIYNLDDNAAKITTSSSQLSYYFNKNGNVESVKTAMDDLIISAMKNPQKFDPQKSRQFCQIGDYNQAKGMVRIDYKDSSLDTGYKYEWVLNSRLNATNKTTIPFRNSGLYLYLWYNSWGLGNDGWQIGSVLLLDNLELKYNGGKTYTGEPDTYYLNTTPEKFKKNNINNFNTDNWYKRLNIPGYSLVLGNSSSTDSQLIYQINYPYYESTSKYKFSELTKEITIKFDTSDITFNSSPSGQTILYKNIDWEISKTLFNKGSASINTILSYSIKKSAYESGVCKSETTLASNTSTTNGDGKYSFNVKDKYGNEKDLNLIVDKTKPEINNTSYSFIGGIYYLQDTTTLQIIKPQLCEAPFESIEVNTYSSVDGGLNFSKENTKTITIFNDNVYKQEIKKSNKEDEIKKFEIIIQDKAGNSNQFTYIIDPSTPKVSINGGSNSNFKLINNINYTSQQISIKAQGSNLESLIVKQKIDNAEQTQINASLISTSTYSGAVDHVYEYTFEVINKAKKSSGVSAKYIIDRRKPKLKINNEDLKEVVRHTRYENKSIDLEVDSTSIFSPQILKKVNDGGWETYDSQNNDRKKIKLDSIGSEPVTTNYVIKIVDILGNTTPEIEININKSNPSGNYDRLKSQYGHVNKWYRVYTGFNTSSIFGNNNAEYEDFLIYNDARERAYAREFQLSFTVEKDNDNLKILNFNSESRGDLDIYNSIFINGLDKQGGVTEWDGTNLSLRYNTSDLIVVKDTLANGIYYIYLNESNSGLKLYTKTQLDNEIYNKVDNIVSPKVISFYQDRSTPINTNSNLSILPERQISLANNTIYKKSEIISASKIVNSPKETTIFNKDKQIFVDDTSQEGRYEIKETNEFGNSFVWNLIIDKTSPILTNQSGNFNEFPLSGALFDHSTTVLLSDNLDANPVIKITKPNSEVETYTTSELVANQYTLTEKGYYTLEVYDAAGNSKSYEIGISTSILDYTTGTFKNIISNEQVTGLNFNVKVEAPNSLVSYTVIKTSLDGLEILENYGDSLNQNEFSVNFSTDGIYKVNVIDKLGNSFNYIKIFEKEAPIGQIFLKKSGSSLYTELTDPMPPVTPSQFYFNYDESLSTEIYYKSFEAAEEEKLSNIYSGKVMSIAGYYRIVLIGENKRTTYNVVIDKTPPKADINEINYDDSKNAINPSSSTFYRTNKNVVLSWLNYRDQDQSFNGIAKVRVYNETLREEYILNMDDPTQRTRSLTLYLSGKYTLEFYDYAGNSVIYKIQIDKDPPKVELIVGSANLIGEYSNKNVKVIVSDNDGVQLYVCTKELSNPSRVCEITDYKTSFASPTTFSANAKYVIYAVDNLGNSSYTIFEISRIEPVGTLKNMSNNNILLNNVKTKDNVSFEWIDDTYQILVNNNVVFNTNFLTFEEEGVYNILIKDKYSNQITYNFTINRTPPKATLTNVENGGITNKSVRMSFNNNIKAYDEQERLISNPYFTADGIYNIKLVDDLGNEAIYTFEILSILPVGDLIGVENKKSTNQNVSFNWNTEFYDYTCLINGNTYESGVEIIFEGNYTVELFDKIGNKNTYTFEIDRTSPIVNLVGVINYGTSADNVYANWTEKNAIGSLYNVSSNLTTVYTSNTLIRNDGEYVLSISDLSGNSTIFNFTIDKSIPTDIFFLTKYEELLEVRNSTDKYINIGFYILANSNYKLEINRVESIFGSIIDSEGIYDITITKLELIKVNYRIIVDFVPPIIYSDIDFSTNYFINKDVVFYWYENNIIAKLSYTNNTEAVITNYTKNEKIRNEGSYIIYLTDQAGNTSSCFFIIDKTAPTGFFEGLDITKLITNQNVKFTPNGLPELQEPIQQPDEEEEYPDEAYDEEYEAEEPNKEFIILLNNEEWDYNNVLTTDGVYIIRIIDLAGNETVYSFSIDKTNPTIELYNKNNELIDGDHINQSFKIVTDDSKYDSIKLNNSNYNSTLVSNNGVYTINATDKAGNQSSKTIYLKTKINYKLENEDNTNIRYNSSKNYYVSTGLFNIIITDDELESEYKIFLDETEILEPSINLDGLEYGIHTIKILDNYSNIEEFKVYYSPKEVEIPKYFWKNVALISLFIVVFGIAGSIIFKKTSNRNKGYF
jgi:hypothetical protein